MTASRRVMSGTDKEGNVTTLKGKELEEFLRTSTRKVERPSGVGLHLYEEYGKMES